MEDRHSRLPPAAIRYIHFSDCDDADDSEKTIPLSRESSPPSSPLVMDENLSPQRQPTSTDESISKSSQTVHTGIFSSKL